MSDKLLIDALDVAKALGEYEALAKLAEDITSQANEALRRYKQLKQEMVDQHGD